MKNVFVLIVCLFGLSFNLQAMVSEIPTRAKPDPFFECHACKKKDSVFRCKVCGTRYCGTECQVNDWHNHKSECMHYKNYLSRLRTEIETKEVLKIINPHFAIRKGYDANCDNAALVYDYYLHTGSLPSGYESGAHPFFEKEQHSYLLKNLELIEKIGFDASVAAAHQFKSITTLNDEIATRRNGSRFLVKGYILNNGHLFPDTWIAFIVDGVLYHVKPQIGVVLEATFFARFNRFAYYQTF